MRDNEPITVLAQTDDVTVFQTAAYLDRDEDKHSEGAAYHQTGRHQIAQHQTSYGAFNLGLHVHDDSKSVLTHRMRLLAAINEYLGQKRAHTPVNALHWVNQVHGNRVYEVDSTPLVMEPINADAMVANQAGQGLAIMTADCVPIVLYQPASSQIAAIHAGWQGLACGVIGAAVSRFDLSIPIFAWMGACISQERYEVGRETIDALKDGCLDNQCLAPPYEADFDARYVQASGHKYLLNLPLLAAHQLQSAGVTLKTALPVPCSYTDWRYYSYRRMTHLHQSATGRMALVIVRHT